jgi:carboxyl-terminal processing protease
VTFGVGIGVGRVPDLATSGAAAASPAASPGNELALVDEAWNKLHQNYVDAAHLDDQKLAYAAIDGMTNAIGDTGHTEFMTPEERASRRSSLSGSYAGIGAEVDTSPEGLPMVVGVFRGSPAEKAGLHAGDIVLTIDGTSTKGETLDETVGRVRGEPGTTVKLTVRNGADGPVRNVDIVRADVHIDPVSWAMVPGTKTAVLRLEQFSTGAADELHKALQAITKAGADRLILDLRGNPGGFVNEAVAVASEFLPGGNVYIERNAKARRRRHRSSRAASRRRSRSSSSSSKGTASGRDRGGAIRTRAGRRSSARRRSGPGRSSASSRSPMGPRSGSGRSSG